MANYQLGPEAPRPFSVLTENHVRCHVELPYIPEHERYSFGEMHEKKMCELIHKYLELDTNDRLCYVGEPKGSLTSMLQSKFCLMEPITTVVPGHIHYEESPNHRMLPIKVANVGAEEFFHRAATSGSAPLFDKILLKDAVRYLEDPKKTFQDALKMLSDFGRIVIIQRPASMNTLPFFSDAKNRLMENDQSYLQIIKDLQSCNLDVQWDIECLPITMTKTHWYSMLKDRYPPQMEMVSPFEVTSGLRELSEGILKYGDELIEFRDRLLFISASRTLFSDTPHIARYGTPAHVSNPLPPASDNPMTYSMEVSKDMEVFVREKVKRERLNTASRGYKKVNKN